MGTLWGTYKEFLAFITALTDELHNGPVSYNKMNDQASANVLIYYRKMFSNVLRPNTNYDGYVISYPYFMDNDGNITNEIGEIAAVVHEYDRKFGMTRTVINKYCDEVSALTRLKIRYRLNIGDRIQRLRARLRNIGLAKTLWGFVEFRLNRFIIRRK